MKSRRRIVLIDRPVQIGLVARLAFQWLTFLVTVVVTLPLFRAILLGDFATPIAERAVQAGVDAAIIAGLFVLLFPSFIYDTFRITNRFAGPMYRLQQAIRDTGRGERFQPIKFREEDYWQDVAKEFNEMVERLEREQHDGAESESLERETVSIGG